MERFDLFIVVRNQVRDRAEVRRGLAVEAAMVALAEPIGVDPGLAALAGLGSAIDRGLCAQNPTRRGEVAAEILMTEGAPEPVVEAVRVAFREAPARMPALAGLLALADDLVQRVYVAMEDEPGGGLDAVDPGAIEMAIERKATRRGDPDAQRARECARVLGLPLADAAPRVHAAMLAIRADLRL